MTTVVTVTERIKYV